MMGKEKIFVGQVTDVYITRYETTVLRKTDAFPSKGDKYWTKEQIAVKLLSTYY
jgi:hypothetical protein